VKTVLQISLKQYLLESHMANLRIQEKYTLVSGLDQSRAAQGPSLGQLP